MIVLNGISALIALSGGGEDPDVIPAGVIVLWSGTIATIPAGWALCDGTLGTPNLQDRFVIGENVAPGSSGGTVNADAGLAHDAHAVTQPDAHAAHVVTQPNAHVVTQPSAHAAHVVTQPNNHVDVVNHVHREFRNSVNTGGLDGWAAGDTSTNTPTLTGYSTDNPTAGGVAAQVHSGTAVDGHSAHAGTAVDAHAGTAVDAHSAHAGAAVAAHAAHAVMRFYRLAYIQKL
jgi:hypothetical protein